MEDFNFTAKVTNISTTGLNKYLKAGVAIDVNTTNSELIVKFHLDFDAREYGIKSIGVMVDSITGELNWEASDDELSLEEIATLTTAGGTHFNNGDISGSIEINSNEGWTVNDDDLKFQDDGQLLVGEIEIDLMEKTIKVS